MNAVEINTVTFASATDEQIVEQAKKILRLRNPALLTPTQKRLLAARKPDVEVAGKILWAQLCREGSQ